MSSGSGTAAHLGDWAQPTDPTETATMFLARALGPDAWAQFLEMYGGQTVYIPGGFDYAARNLTIRRQFEEMKMQGVRYTDAVNLLARYTKLTARRIEQIIAKKA